MLQAVVLEGKYWKRRPDAVASEYRKWRYHRERKVTSPLCIDVVMRVLLMFCAKHLTWLMYCTLYCSTVLYCGMLQGVSVVLL